MRMIHQIYRPVKRVLSRHTAKTKIADQLARGKSLRIVIGSGGIYQRNWIPTDIDTLNLLSADDWRFLFFPDSIDAALAEHVWEHLTFDQGLEAARNCYRYLRSGAYLRVAVPDGFHPSREYISCVRPGGTGAGASDHKVLYTFKSFKEVFSRAGFEVHLLEYFDENGEFHYEEWNPEDGMISRSKRFDTRNQPGLLNYTSIVLDARKACVLNQAGCL